MFITEEEKQNRLDNKNNLVKNISVIIPELVEPDDQARRDLDTITKGFKLNRDYIKHDGIRGRKEGDNNVPQMFREIIASQAHFDKQTDVAKSWGVSPASVTEYKNGNVSQNPESRTNKDIKAAVNSIVDKIREKVADRITTALDYMNDDKMENLDAKTLSSITSNLSRVLASTAPKDLNAGINNHIQTIIYAPQTANIEEYTSIEVPR